MTQKCKLGTEQIVCPPTARFDNWYRVQTVGLPSSDTEYRESGDREWMDFELDFISPVWVTRTWRLPNMLSSLSKSCDGLMCFFICSEELEPASRASESLQSTSPPALPLRPISVAPFISMLLWLVCQPPGGFTFLYVYMHLLKTTKAEQLTLKDAFSGFCCFVFRFLLQPPFNVEGRAKVCVVKEKHPRVCKRFMDNASLLWVVLSASCRPPRL